MIFPVIVYVLIGLAITSFMYGFIGYESDGVFVISVIAWPILMIAVLVILFVNLFYWLGKHFKED